MIGPLDDQLRAHIDALQAIERPTAAARAATWAAIDARVSAAVVPLRRTRPSWTLAALAAAVALGIGLAAATSWRSRAGHHVEAIHQSAGVPTLMTPRAVDVPGPALAPVVAPVVAPPEPQQGITTPERGESAPTRRARPAGAPSLRPEEVASFQRAQAALAADRPGDALQALEEHGRRFAGGVFEEERQVSRAAALCKLGRVADAGAARRRFLRERPGSHLAERMRQICRETEGQIE